MSKVSMKAKGNVYYEARINSNNRDLSNRMIACKIVGMNKQRMEYIELNKQDPYPSEVISMAKEYDAPYLIEHYCNHICQIGQKFGCKYTVNKSDAYKATVMFVHSLKEAEQAKERILEILSDGEITIDEISMLDASISKLNETMSDIINLKIALEKEKIKGGLK